MDNKLQNIKEEVAEGFGYKSNSVFSAYEQLLINPHGSTYRVLNDSVDKIAIRYANEQKQELVEMLEMVVMDMEERGRAYGDVYMMSKELLTKYQKQ